MTATKTQVTVEVRERFISTKDRPCWIAIVTTARGRCFSCTWAGDKPTEETVLKAWREDRKAFDPYVS
jgi:hypothetical protein